MKALPMSFDVLAVSRQHFTVGSDFWAAKFRWSNPDFFGWVDAKLAFADAWVVRDDGVGRGSNQIHLFTSARPPSRRVFLTAHGNKLVFDRVEDIPDVGVVEETEVLSEKQAPRGERPLKAP